VEAEDLRVLARGEDDRGRRGLAAVLDERVPEVPGGAAARERREWGLYTSIAIGVDGFGFISYYTSELKVAHCSTVFGIPWARYRQVLYP